MSKTENTEAQQQKFSLLFGSDITDVSLDTLPSSEQELISTQDIRVFSERCSIDAPYPSQKLQFLAEHLSGTMKLCFPLPESAIDNLQRMTDNTSVSERFRLQLEFERLLNLEKNDYPKKRRLKDKIIFEKLLNQKIERYSKEIENKIKMTIECQLEKIDPNKVISDEQKREHILVLVHQFRQIFTTNSIEDKLSILCYVVPDNSFKNYCVLYLGRQYTLHELKKLYNERVKSNNFDFQDIFSSALNSAYIGWLFSNAEFWQDLKLLQDHARNSGLEDMGYLKNFTDIRSKALASIIDLYFGRIPCFSNIFKNMDTLSVWPVYPEYACFCKKWRLLEMASNFFPISIDMLHSDDVKTHDDLCYPEAPPTVFHYYFDEKFKKAKLDDERLVPKHLRTWAEMMQGGTVGINKALRYHRNFCAYIIIQSIEDRIKPHLKISNNIINKILAAELCLSAEASYRILRAINDARNSNPEILKSYIPIVETESYRELIRRMKENWFCVDDSIKLSGVYPIHGVKIETDPKTNTIILTGNVDAINKAADDYRKSEIGNIGYAENTIDCALILDNDSEAANLADKSRDTVRRYKFIFSQGGPQALKNQMRDKPLSSNRVRPELEEMVLQTALGNPKLGRNKISSHILENFNVTISPSTVQSILSRYNLMSIQQRAKAQKEQVSPSGLINAQKQDDSSTAFSKCSMEDIIETFLANPKIARTELVNLLHEKYGVLFEPEKLAGLIQHCARFIQEIRRNRTPVEKRPGLHMTAKARRKAIKMGLVLPFWGEITKSTPLDIT